MKTLNILLIAFFSFLGNSLFSQDMTGIRIHINPGHGGWDSDDRGITTPLYPVVGPNVGFWESQSNLDKGFHLRDMLEELGCEVQMSRTQNRTQDDLPLTTIVQMANEFQSDFMLSIHSNAGAGTANYVLMLYAGQDVGDNYPYTNRQPEWLSDKSREISTLIGNNLIKNQLTHWTAATPRITGDKTFGRLSMGGWTDGYGVLRNLNVPGVISEGAMHDYIPETYRLLNMDYKWLEAWNFKKAFCTYFAKAEIPTGNISGWVKDGRNLLQESGASYHKFGKDVLLPLNGATISILGTDKIYTVDNQRNGVYVFKDLDPGVYNVKAEAEGYYEQTKEITVVKNQITYYNFELNKIRDTPPEVIKYSPNIAAGEAVECSTDIVLEFNWDMDEESVRNAFSITPDAEGTITFEDSQYRMRFKPILPLETATIYTVKLDKSAKHPDEKSMEEDFTFKFMTKDRNRLVVLQAYPEDGSKGVYYKDPVFWLIFDRRLNTTNLRDEIKVINENGAEMTKATRSVKNNNVPAPYGAFFFQLGNALEPEKQYKVIIGADVKDEVGVMVVDPIEINFTTSVVEVTDKTVIEDFETAGKFVYDAEQSANVTGASIARNTSTSLFGGSTYQLRGTFTAEDAYVTFKVATPASVVNNQEVIGLHVYGDLSQNELQLLFSDGSGVWSVKICDLNFAGWEFVEADLSSLPSSEEYTLTGIRVVRKEGILSGTLEIYIDNMLLYDDPLMSLLPVSFAGQIEIYPNPATEVIYVKTFSNEIPLLSLYSFSGSLLKEVRANEIIVKEFSAGTYILKVSTEKGIFGKPVIIYK